LAFCCLPHSCWKLASHSSSLRSSPLQASRSRCLATHTLGQPRVIHPSDTQLQDLSLFAIKDRERKAAPELASWSSRRHSKLQPNSKHENDFLNSLSLVGRRQQQHISTHPPVAVHASHAVTRHCCSAEGITPTAVPANGHVAEHRAYARATTFARRLRLLAHRHDWKPDRVVGHCQRRVAENSWRRQRRCINESKKKNHARLLVAFCRLFFS
jgi:hypothetical protein